MFPCSYPGCDATYQRKEHLNRHITQRHQGTRLCCQYCNSTLSRRKVLKTDLLRRHIRIFHPQNEAPLARAQRACSACRTRKERCDSGNPCSACLRRGVSCTRDQPGGSGRREPEAERSLGLPPSLSDPYRSPSCEVVEDEHAEIPAVRWKLQEYLDIYFKEFHPIWPFLHPGTFDVTREPCVLVQSIMMMGLWVKGGPERKKAAVELHFKLISAIYAQMEQWYVPETEPHQKIGSLWPMPTYQSILLQIIFALFMAKEKAEADLTLRYQLQDDEFGLLVALVQSCRRLGMFCYPNMLAQHSPTAPLALMWVNVEEIKRFGLALYKVCRMSAPPASCGGSINSSQELLTLADLEFCMPDSDEVWNAREDAESAVPQRLVARGTSRHNGDQRGWISNVSGVVSDPHVNFDWI